MGVCEGGVLGPRDSVEYMGRQAIQDPQGSGGREKTSCQEVGSGWRTPGYSWDYERIWGCDVWVEPGNQTGSPRERLQWGSGLEDK